MKGFVRLRNEQGPRHSPGNPWQDGLAPRRRHRHQVRPDRGLFCRRGHLEMRLQQCDEQAGMDGRAQPDRRRLVTVRQARPPGRRMLEGIRSFAILASQVRDRLPGCRRRFEIEHRNCSPRRRLGVVNSMQTNGLPGRNIKSPVSSVRLRRNRLTDAFVAVEQDGVRLARIFDAPAGRDARVGRGLKARRRAGLARQGRLAQALRPLQGDPAAFGSGKRAAPSRSPESTGQRDQGLPSSGRTAWRGSRRYQSVHRPAGIQRAEVSSGSGAGQ